MSRFGTWLGGVSGKGWGGVGKTAGAPTSKNRSEYRGWGNRPQLKGKVCHKCAKERDHGNCYTLACKCCGGGKIPA